MDPPRLTVNDKEFLNRAMQSVEGRKLMEQALETALEEQERTRNWWPPLPTAEAKAVFAAERLAGRGELFAYTQAFLEYVRDVMRWRAAPVPAAVFDHPPSFWKNNNRGQAQDEHQTCLTFQWSFEIRPPVIVKLFFRQSDLMPSRIRGEYPGVAFEHPHLAPWPELTTDAQRTEFAACRRLQGFGVDTAYKAAFLTDVLKYLKDTDHHLAPVALAKSPDLVSKVLAVGNVGQFPEHLTRKPGEYWMRLAWTWFYHPKGKSNIEALVVHQWFDENDWHVTRIVVLDRAAG